jgi:hypothetical protein
VGKINGAMKILKALGFEEIEGNFLELKNLDENLLREANKLF